jgi:hypothetical protein
VEQSFQLPSLYKRTAPYFNLLFLFIFLSDKNVYLNFLRGIAMEKVVIYARVSTNDQTTENQILKLWSIVEKNE